MNNQVILKHQKPTLKLQTKQCLEKFEDFENWLCINI